MGNPQIDYIEGLPLLNGAEGEALSIGTIFPIQKVYLRQDATKTAFRSDADHYDVFHIACHSLFNTTDP